MERDQADVASLILVLRRHFEQDATRDDVRASVRESCNRMHDRGVPPQTMLVALKAAVQNAALDARTPVSREAFRGLISELTPWMIDVCFAPRSPQAR